MNISEKLRAIATESEDPSVLLDAADWIDQLTEAAYPFVEIANAFDTKSLTGVDDRVYSPDGLVHLRLSDCKAIRKIVKG